MRQGYLAGLTKNSFLLAATSLFADISTEMLYPVLPLFMVSALAAPASIIGIVEGVAEGTQQVVQGLSGPLSDRLGRKKPVAAVGYGLAALAKPLIGLSAAWPQALAGRFLDRLGTGVRSAPRDALLASSVAEAYRGKAFGLEGIGDNLGAVIGPLLTVVLLYALHVDLRVIFFLAFVPGLLALCAMLLTSEAGSGALQRAGAKEQRRPDPRALPSDYWTYLAATAVFGVGNSSNAFLILRANQAGVSTEATVLVYAAFNLVAALSSWPAGTLSDRIGPRRLVLAALGIFTIAYLLFAASSQILVLAVVLIAYGAYQGVFRAAGKAMATALTPGDLRATGIGLYSSTIGISGLLASVIGGQLWDRLGPAATFLFGAGCSVLGMILLMVIVPDLPRPARAPRDRAAARTS